MAELSENRVDALIAGGGIVGLTLAVALRQALGETFVVAVADPALARGVAGDGRATAIVAAARRLLQTLGVWQKIEPQPILDMVVTDSRLTDVMRPTFLTFAGEIEPGEPFGHMVENAPLITALLDCARECGVLLLPTAVAEFSLSTSNNLSSIPPPERWRSTRAARRVGVSARAYEADPHPNPPPFRGREELADRLGGKNTVELADGSVLGARLLVAADGAKSRIRERAGIAVHGWAYGQSAIVTTVEHERDHHGRAEEHFLPSGPFATLPLTGRRSSIVWTETAQEAERILSLPDGEFHDELERRFGLRLGDIAAVGARRALPLGLWVARAFVKERLALVGDAAHVIHPIAGQGLNMGLKDAAALAEVVTDAARVGLDPGSLATLERYERWRRFDTMSMGLATDLLNRLFSNESGVLRLVRDVGLGLVDRAPALKQFFIREAAGLVGDVPRLLRGEAL
jgi:2-octaprenyl-6-methoxyphenol hydroxylase